MGEKIVISLGKYYYPTKGGVEKVTKDIAEIVYDMGFKSSGSLSKSVEGKMQYKSGIK